MYKSISVFLFIVSLFLGLYSWVIHGKYEVLLEKQTSIPATQKDTTSQKSFSDGYIAHNVKIYQERKLIYSGDRDLTELVNKIKNHKIKYTEIFENREKRLPIKSSGYYKVYDIETPEWTLHTRGPERLIVGGNDEYYYSSDHYESFIKI